MADGYAAGPIWLAHHHPGQPDPVGLMPAGRTVNRTVNRADSRAVALVPCARFFLLSLLLVLGAAASAASVEGQQQDSAQAGVRTKPSTRRTPVPRDSIKGPPISPGRAFLYSLLLPGLGQAKLDRPSTGILFATIEVISILQLRQAEMDLAYAKRHHADTVVLYDSTVNGVVQYDSTGRPIPGAIAYNPYSSDRVNARGVHAEDWIAALIFNHLIAGADAFVAANLWDLPQRVTIMRAPDGAMVVAITIPIRGPPL